MNEVSRRRCCNVCDILTAAFLNKKSGALSRIVTLREIDGLRASHSQGRFVSAMGPRIPTFYCYNKNN
jgi:hypothetical protein